MQSDASNEHPLTKDLLIERLRSQCPRELRGKIDQGLEEMLSEASPLRPFDEARTVRFTNENLVIDKIRSTRRLAVSLFYAACGAQNLLYELQVSPGKKNRERAQAIGQLLDTLLILTNAACEMDGDTE